MSKTQSQQPHNEPHTQQVGGGPSNRDRLLVVAIVLAPIILTAAWVTNAAISDRQRQATVAERINLALETVTANELGPANYEGLSRAEPSWACFVVRNLRIDKRPGCPWSSVVFAAPATPDERAVAAQRIVSELDLVDVQGGTCVDKPNCTGYWGYLPGQPKVEVSVYAAEYNPETDNGPFGGPGITVTMRLPFPGEEWQLVTETDQRNETQTPETPKR